MALPTGDDEQTIIWRIVAETADAGQRIDSFRQMVQELKDIMRQISAETNSSFAQVRLSIENNLEKAADKAKQELQNVKQTIRELTQRVRVQPGTDVEREALAVDTRNLAEAKARLQAIRDEVKKTTQELKQFRDTAPQAMKELNADAKVAATSMASVSVATTQTAVATNTLFQQLSTQTLTEKINTLRVKIVELQQASGLSFKEIIANMKLAFREEAKASVDTFKLQLRSAKEELNALNKSLAINPAGANAAALAQMQARIAQLNTLIPQLNANIRNTSQTLNQANSALSTVQQQLTQTGNGVNILGVQINSLGDIVKLVFIGLLGGSVIGALSKLSAFLSELLEKSLDFTRAVFQLEVGVRALRRAGIDLSFEEVVGNLDDINDGLGNLFSNLELLEGAAAFTNLIRDLGLTKEQILELQQSVATLAVVNGRSMEDVQRTVALALSSGYTEGLQRLGVSINRLTIAEEANRIGFEGGYVALTEQQRAIATYNLLVRKTAIYTDDMAKAQETLFGSIQKSNAAIENEKALVGQTYLPFKAALLEVVATLFELGRKFNFIFVIARGVAAIFSEIRAIADLTASVLKELLPTESFEEFRTSVQGVRERLAKLIPKPIVDAVDDLNESVAEMRRRFLELHQGVRKFIELHPALKKFLQDTKDAMNSVFGEGEQELTFEGNVSLGEPLSTEQDKILGMLEEEFGDIQDLEEEVAEKRKDAAEDLQEDLAKIERKGIRDRAEIIRDYARDIAELERDTARRIQEVANNLQRKLSEIDIKLKFDIDEANLRFEFDTQEVQRKFLEDVAKAQEEYRQEELERERKYQEELLRLREDYLMELEEALENRDARAVLRARRQFNLEKERARRENEEEKLSNKEGLANELRDLTLRREARLRELKFELEQRIAEMQRNAQFEREEAARQAAQDIIDLQRRLQEEREERKRQFEQRMQDQRVNEALDKAHRWLDFFDEMNDIQHFEQEKLRLIGEFLAQQAILMGLSNEEIRQLAEAYFGDSGYVTTIYRNFVAMVQEMISQLGRGVANLRGLPKPSKFQKSTINQNTEAFEFASGGAAIAKKPTTVQFGEVPELALFAPLNQLDKISGLLGDGVGSSKDGMLNVRVTLSPELKAEIIEQTKDDIANIMFEVQRQ